MPVYKGKCYVVVVLFIWMASSGASVILDIRTKEDGFKLDFSSTQFSQFQGCLCSSNTVICRVRYGPLASVFSRVRYVKDVNQTPMDKNQTGLFQCKNTIFEFLTGEIKCIKQTEVEFERKGFDCCSCIQLCNKNCIPLLETPDLTITGNTTVKFCYPSCRYLSTEKMIQMSTVSHGTSDIINTAHPENSTKKKECTATNSSVSAIEQENSTSNFSVQTIVSEITTLKVSLKTTTFNDLVNDSTFNTTVVAKETSETLYKAMLILAITVTLLISAGFVICIIRRRVKKSQTFLPNIHPSSAGSTLERVSNHDYEEVDLILNDENVQSNRANLLLISNKRCPQPSGRSKNRGENHCKMVDKVGPSYGISTDPSHGANSTKCNSIDENEQFAVSDTVSYRCGTTNIYSRLHQKIRRFGIKDIYDVLSSQESLQEQRPQPELCVSQERLEERCYSLVMPNEDMPDGAYGGEDTTIY